MMRISAIIIVLSCVFFVGCGAGVGQKMKSFSKFDIFSKHEDARTETEPETMDKTIGIGLGMTAPDFEIILLNGESGGMLSDFRGKPVLLNFWASWCGPCVMEMPDIQKVHEDYGDNVHIIAVDVGEKADIVQEFIEENGYEFTIALDSEAAISHVYRIQTIPQSFILDADGKIIKHIPFTANTETFMEALNPLIDAHSANPQ